MLLSKVCRGDRSLNHIRQLVNSKGLGARAFHRNPITCAKILASDSIESICGDVFKSRGHGKLFQRLFFLYPLTNFVILYSF